MPYQSYSVNLSKNQKPNLSKAFRNEEPITIRLSNKDLRGNDPLNQTKTQIKKIERLIKNKVGCDLKISKSQIRKAVGGSLLSSLMMLVSKMLPCATKVATPLVTGALSGLSSLGVNKLFGSSQSGGFIIPQSKILKND